MNKLLHIIGLSILGLTVVAPASSQTAPGSARSNPTEQKADLVELIKQGIKSGTKTITIPPGRYRVTPQNGVHLALRGLRDITIIADGVEMICTQNTLAIQISDCENITIEGLTIDYDPLPYTQARIVNVTENELKVEVIPGYPPLPNGSTSVQIFDRLTSKPIDNTNFYYSLDCEITGPGQATIKENQVQYPSFVGTVGDFVVIDTIKPVSPPHTVVTQNSNRITFRNVTIFTGSPMGFFDDNSNELKYLSCRVDRRPANNDIVQRGHQRLRSVSGRSFVSNNARIGPVYERCTSLFNVGESFLIQGDFYYIASSTGSTLRILASEEHCLKEGDTVQFFGPNGVRADNRKILKIGAGTVASDSEIEAFSNEKNINEKVKKLSSIKAYTVTLDAALKDTASTLMSSADANGKGFIIKDCFLGNTNSAGISVSAVNGQIIGNKIIGVSGTGIRVSPIYAFLKGGFADDLKIIKNTITEGDGMGIAIIANGRDGKISPEGTYRNITVSDNTVTGGASPGLLITSVRGLKSTNNNIQTERGLPLARQDKILLGAAIIRPVMTINSK